MDRGMNTGCEGIRRKYDTAVFEKHQLENGITIWLQKPPILVSEAGVLAAVLNGIGSQADPPNEYGTAHFFEHIPFRGTENKPSELEIKRPLRNAGGGIYAQTGILYTRFQISVPAGSLKLAVETLIEMVTKPIISEEAVKLEKEVIDNEYAKTMADDKSVWGKHYLQTVFPHSPWNHLPIGAKKVIEGMTKEKLRNFHSRFYHSGNLEVICGGSFSIENGAVDKIADGFKSVRRGESFRAHMQSAIKRYPAQAASRVCLSDEKFGQDRLLKVFSLPPVMSLEEEYAIHFLADILVSGMDSPLMQELRGKRGFIYSADCFLDRLPGISKFVLNIPTSRNNFVESVDVIRDVLKKLDRDYVFARQRARQIKRKTAFKEADVECLSIGSELFHFGRLLSYREVEKIQDNLSLEEIFWWRDCLLGADVLVIEMTN